MTYRNLLSLVLVSVSFFHDTPVAFGQSTWIYRDTVESPWFLNGNGATITTQSTEQVYSGTYSLKMVVSQWTMPMFRTTNWSQRPIFLKPTDYSAIELYIYPVGNAARLYFELQNDSTSQEWYGSGNPYVYSSGQWTKVSIPMNEISTGGHTFDVMNIMESNRGVTWYIDDMRLADVPTSAEQQDTSVPAGFALRQNFPNPFNGSTKIEFDLPHACLVSLKLYNVLGQEVATVVDKIQEAGHKSVDFNAARLSSGLYYYRLAASHFVDTKKFLLVK